MHTNKSPECALLQDIVQSNPKFLTVDEKVASDVGIFIARSYAEQNGAISDAAPVSSGVRERRLYVEIAKTCCVGLSQLVTS